MARSQTYHPELVYDAARLSSVDSIFNKTSVVGVLLNDKWSPRLLLLLEKRQRFSDIKRALGISAKTLSARLKFFEEQDLLKRTIYAQVPVRVEYELTEKGRDFVQLMLAIVRREEGISSGGDN